MIEISDDDIKFLAEQVEAALRLKDNQDDTSLLAGMTSNQVTWSAEAWLVIAYSTPLVAAYLRGRGLPPPDPDNVPPAWIAIETAALMRMFIFAVNQGDCLPNMSKCVDKALLDANIALRIQE